MTITEKHDEWLKNAGYKYYAFISWPHIKNENMKACAIAIKKRIEEDLRLDVEHPQIFFDVDEIRAGYQWEKVLNEALCKSATMVALCAPMYYSKNSHEWCGIEWASMELLSQRRLGGGKLHTILPILVKKHEPPAAVTKVQYSSLNLQGVVVSGYYESDEFKIVCQSILEHIERVVWKLKEKNSLAECHNFKPPTVSPFEDFKNISQPFPR